MPDLLDKFPSATAGPLIGTESAYLVTAGGVDGRYTVDTLTAGRVVNAGGLNVTGSTIPTNGPYLAAANTVGLATNGTLRVSVSTTALSSSLNTIIGSTSVASDGTLHVHTASAGTVDPQPTASNFVVENAGDVGATFLARDGDSHRFYFGVPSNNAAAGFFYSYSADNFEIQSRKVGQTLGLNGDDNVRNLTLSGGTGSELTAAAGAITAVKGITAFSATAIPAGGTTGSGLTFSSTANFGFFFGSGAPTLSAARGSYYARSDGSGTNDRAYINTDGSTTWTAVVTVA